MHKSRDWRGTPESRMIHVALERIIAGESPERVAADYGLESWTFGEVARKIIKASGAKKAKCSLCDDSEIVEVHDKITGEFISDTDCPLCVGKEIPMDELMKALKPFAELADAFDLHEDCIVYKVAGTAITAGDIRRAQATYRAHLEKAKTATDGGV